MKKVISILLCAVMLLVSCGINDKLPVSYPEASDTDTIPSSEESTPHESTPPESITEPETEPEVPPVAPRKTELIESPEPMRYIYGKGSAVISGPSDFAADTRAEGMSVITCAIECLPDTYYEFSDWYKTEIRLVRMKVLKNLGKYKVLDEFYLMVPVDFMTDFTTYGSFVIKDLVQYGYEGFVLYNKTLGCAERFDLPLCACSPYNFISAENMIAFDKNDNFDISLWYSTLAWEAESENYIEYMADGKYALVSDGYTLAQTEEKLMERINDSQEYSFMHTISDANEEERKALDYVLSAENGLFIAEHEYYAHYAPYQITYRTQRYIEGYPTNETLSISRDKIEFSSVKFTAEDIENMPDLAYAMKGINEEFQNGNIKAPHLTVNVSGKTGYFGIFGWYEKSENGVFGIVRITWKFLYDNKIGYVADDKYYVVTAEGYEDITRDELLNLVNNDLNYIYTKSYGSSGKLFD